MAQAGTFVEAITASAKHVGKAGKHLGKAATVGFEHAKDGLAVADRHVSAQIQKHGDVWGAMKAGAKEYPVSAAAIATVGTVGTVYAGSRVFGRHTADIDRRRAQYDAQRQL